MKDNYVKKSVTFNCNSKQQMEIFDWCRRETKDFKAQNFSNFVREKLEWCIKHENQFFSPATEQPNTGGWSSLI
jgi:hypothetical protein